MDEKKLLDILFDREVEIEKGIKLYIPTVKEAAYSDRFGISSTLFTIETRDLFAALRDVNELASKFPYIWDIMRDPDWDAQVGVLFGEEDKALSDLFIEALAYWTRLDANNFVKLGNGKIMHVDPDWILGREDLLEFSNIIKTITNYTPPEQSTPDFTSDKAYNMWKSIYEGRRKQQQRRALTWVDRILILSISTPEYMKPSEIAQMSVFDFYQLFSGLSKKDAYDIKMAYQMSSKYKGDEKGVKHWKEQYKVNVYNNK